MAANERKDAIALSEEIMRSYFCDNEVEFLISLMAPDIVWLGAGKNQRATGKEAVAASFRNGLRELFPCVLSNVRTEAFLLNEGSVLCIYESDVDAAEASQMHLHQHQRASFLFCRANGEFRLQHIHHSMPYTMIEPSELFPAHAAHEAWKKLESTLNARERQIELMLSQLPGGMMACLDDEKYTVQWISESLCSILGYESTEKLLEAIENSYEKLIYAEDREAVHQFISERLIRGESYQCEYRIVHQDGRILWILESGKSIGIIDEYPIIACYLTDITTRKHKELELDRVSMEARRQAAFLAHLYHSLPYGIVQLSTDPPYEVINANRAALELCGYSNPQDLPDIAKLAMGCLPEDEKYYAELTERLAKEGGSVTYSREGIKHDGTHCRISTTMERMLNADGRQVLQAIFTDITETYRLRIERELEQRQENQMLRTAILSAYPLIIHVNLTENTCSCLRSDEFSSVPVAQSGEYDSLINDVSPLLAQADQAAFRQDFCRESLSANIADARELYRELQGRIGSGSYHWLSVHAIHVESLDSSERRAVILVRLLDEERAEKARQEQLLRDALAAARAASDAKSDFLSRMSHEIRTPMNAIIGISEIALHHTENGIAVKKDIEQISASGHYLLGLINDILDVSRIENGKFLLNPEWCGVHALIEPVLTMICPLMEAKNIHFSIPNTDQTPALSDIEFYIDKMRIRQLLINLLNNACKFTSPGGSVTWSITPISGTENERRSRILIYDNGRGMSPQFLKRIGEPFAQEQNALSAETSGTGLGLYIVKKICENMGCSLEIESTLGKGTRISIELSCPCRKKELTAPHPLEKLTLPHIRILLAEDNMINRKVACYLLSQMGAVVESAANGKEAVDMFAQSAPGYYACVLMDIQMPVMDGLEATKQIRALERPDAATVAIIAMTANAFDSDMKNSLEIGMNAHLSKPIDTKLLHETLCKFIPA